MPILLQASQLSKSYNGQIIFSGLTFSISNRQKIGVIGRNGAGKSTLFKILLGQETSDSGQIIINDQANIGYLKQEDDFKNNESALDYLARLSSKEEWQIKKIASRFQLDDEKLLAPALSLSGGWRMRLKLVGMLLPEPNLFLLDEPTNYLDLNTLLLLEKYLESYSGSFLIISHDREFLKKTCTETLEISKTSCYHYPGNLEAYLEFKEQKLKSLIKSNDNLENQQKHLQEFVDRFRSKASKAKQAQAVIKKINKLENKRIAIEHEAGLTRINIPAVIKKKNIALHLNNLAIGYLEKIIVSNIDFDCPSGEKLAVLGLNGQGKTTLLKTLANQLEALSGSFRFASGSKIAFHGQDPINLLDSSESVELYLNRVAGTGSKMENILKMAGDFLFKNDDLKKSVSVLSGGEKSRLVLAGLLLSKTDVLILDEPTCHLDFETAEALGQGLKKFNGTVIFTSHDRTFTNLLATKLLEISDGRAKTYYGDYEDYVEMLENKLWKEITEKKSSSSMESAEKKERYLERVKNKKNLKALEKELDKLNLRRGELYAHFNNNPFDYNADKAQELEAIEKLIREKENIWLEAMEENK